MIEITNEDNMDKHVKMIIEYLDAMV